MAADVPKIVLTPLERSHHFGRRECVVTEVLKVGRSVDRRRISPNNLIFDCRVLSRNHAQIWFENGKFYIKDTKSSNGTFVNENRLSPSGEESSQVELKSRDIVQFGVNVNVDKKVTHGCIIATVKLYLNEVEVPGHEPPVQQVLHIVQSALAREQELENKLASMQGVLNIAKELASESMIAIVKEDELMSRLEMMESQLQIYSRNATDDELKTKLKEAYEQKRTGDLSAKETIRSIMQEKQEVATKLSQLQRDYDTAEEECQKYKMMYESAKQEHTQEVTKLGTELTKAEAERKTIQEKMVEEKQSLEANLESVKAEADFSKGQLDLAKSRLSETQSKLVDLKLQVETDRQLESKKRALEGNSIDDSLAAALLLGTTEFSIPPNPDLVPPGTEDPSSQTKVEEKFAATIKLEELTETVPPDSTISPSTILGRCSPDQVGLAISSSSGLDRRATLMPVTSRSPVALARLEAELKASQERVKELELLLAAGAATSGGVNSSLASGFVRFGSREGSPEVSMGQIGLEAEAESELLLEERARNLSEVTIAKSQIIILEGHLEEARKKVKKLEGTVRSIQPNMDGKVDSDMYGSEEVGSFKGELQSGQEEYGQLKKKNKVLQGEATLYHDELEKEKNKNETLLAENLVLGAENKAVRQRLSELPSGSSELSRQQTTAQQQQQQQVCGSRANFQQRQKEVEEQHLRILTILALVSLGVALASWLM